MNDCPICGRYPAPKGWLGWNRDGDRLRCYWCNPMPARDAVEEKKRMPTLRTVVELAAMTVDQDGKAQSSPELIAAIQQLDPKDRAQLGVVLGIIRACRSRNRPVPGGMIVGDEMATALQVLSGCPEGAVDVVEGVLDLDEALSMDETR